MTTKPHDTRSVDDAQREEGEPTAVVFDIQRFSVHDGPGIRTTVFFKGCPLHCAWCQNPESISRTPQLMLYPQRCIGCGKCLPACPELDPDNLPEGAFRPETCRNCGLCAKVCPSEARQMAGRKMTVDAICQVALRDKPFYREQGGVTLGGGEPLAQWPVARAVADALRAQGVHVALDTACSVPRAVIEDVPAHIDLVLADLKLVTPDKHRQWTGADNTRILESIRLLSGAMPGRLWISIPLIPGVQDEEELKRMADFLRGLENPPPVRVLEFHRLGESKYEALGLPPPDFSGNAALPKQAATDILATHGLQLMET
ncbi:MAG: glycyl-radical enzyme activating protein [Kiritimatiellae bacterium]|nr:glycyl-radical enzyme activating protein [Kiritimatiellia bacterium]